MAKNVAVWGIDIGQCALKALRCTVEDGKVVADAFDFIEYPKILSQPESKPDDLIHEALEQFLSRNEVKSDEVVLSVPGQSGLSKFFKPPPVEAKKIPDIVKFEARQQIPFDLNEVVWDYQLLAGGGEMDGLAMDTEVGLFAMKRDQVYKSLRPFDRAGVEIDMIQLAPIAIYNFVTYDMLNERMDEGTFDPEHPPESLVLLSMGTDTTDLIVTNGFRVWQRSIPIGGNHFTKQLTKEMKYTFAKAEHLKRNARQAEDPKALFQAMRPVFNDLVTEVQRSISFFQGIDRQATIAGVVMMGNTVKLPGLKQYLAKNLGYDVLDFKEFKRLEGSSVTSQPAFKDNLLAFGTCYGLCLQGLAESELQTNLMPQEILTDRLIRAKKPWAVASVAALILGFAFYYFLLFGIWNSAHPRNWQNLSQARQLGTNSQDEMDEDDRLKQQLEHMKAMGRELSAGNDRMLGWMELLQAVSASMPIDPRHPDPKVPYDLKKIPLDDRPTLYITKLESQYFENLPDWWEPRKARYKLRPRPDGAPKKNDEAGEEEEEPDAPGPEGKGWVIEVHGYHYFNKSALEGGETHLNSTLLKRLLYGRVRLPTYLQGRAQEIFTMTELGITHAILLVEGKESMHTVNTAPAENKAGEGTAMSGLLKGGATAERKNTEAEPEENTEITVARYDFVVQFVWQEKPLKPRIEALDKRRKQEAEEAELKRQEEEEEKKARGDVAVNTN